MSTIAAFLGQPVREMAARVRLDGLPVVLVPSRTRPVRKVAVAAFARWLAARSSGEPLTVEEVRAELERCRAAGRQA